MFYLIKRLFLILIVIMPVFLTVPLVSLDRDTLIAARELEGRKERSIDKNRHVGASHSTYTPPPPIVYSRTSHHAEVVKPKEVSTVVESPKVESPKTTTTQSTTTTTTTPTTTTTTTQTPVK